MATVLGSLLISLGLDSGQFRSGMDAAEKQLVKTQRNLNRIGRSMQDLGSRLTLGLTAPLAAFAGFSVKAASDAHELQSAFDQTFGAMSATMTKWATETGDAMGRSTQEIQQAANTFGIFFNQAAPTRQAAADLSKEFTVLAQDLSSFFNVDPTVALQKLRSGLAGESEPLRDFGVFLNEATVKAKAFEMGIAKAGAELTEQQKIMARAALIMEATTSAQGDVARTADGTANRIRAARAAFDELRVAIGEKLIPALQPLISFLTNVLTGLTNLPGPVQTVIVVIGALVAAIGPLLFIGGSLLTNFVALGSAFAATGGAAAAATPGVALLTGALRGLMLVGGPIVLVLGAIAGAAYLLSQRSAETAQASATQADQQEKLTQIQQRAMTVTELLATATGQARREALAHAQSLREEIQQLRAKAKAEADAARATLARIKIENRARLQSASRTVIGAGSGFDPVTGQARRNKQREDAARKEIMDFEIAEDELTKELLRIDKIIAAPPPQVGTVGDPGKTSKSKGPSGPSSDEIESRFQAELAGLAQQTISAMVGLAGSAEERAELERRSVELALIRTRAEIEADEDYTAAQKQRLVTQLEALAQFERENIERDLHRRLEQERMDLDADAFEVQRDLLQADLQMADTAGERQRVALDILAFEQQYRRNQAEMVLASETSLEHEKERARRLLASLDAIERAETAVARRQTETPVERYRRELNMSVEQVNEAVDGIRIQGLESLNQGLVDAITGVKSLGAVFKNIANQIIADLLRIAIQKAIIGPLADAIFGGKSGGGGGIGSILGGLKLFGSSTAGSIRLSGARAMGGPVLAGGTYLVGERGPELFRPRGSGSIIPNNELKQGGRNGVLTVRLEKDGGLTAHMEGIAGRVVGEAAPGIAAAGGEMAMGRFRKMRERSLVRG